MSRISAMTEVTINLGGDAVDKDGAALYVEVASPTGDNSVIAPWLDESPAPQPKNSSSRSLGFSRKTSFTSFVSLRQNSVATSTRSSRPSTNSQTTLLVPDNLRKSTDESTIYGGSIHSTGSSFTSSSGSGELRKAKSSLNILSKLKSKSSKNLRADSLEAERSFLTKSQPPLPDTYIRKTRLSRPHPRADTCEDEHPSLRPPAPSIPDQSYVSFLDLANASHPPHLFSSIPFPRPVKEKLVKRKKRSSSPTPPTPPPKEVHQFELDTNLEKMDGIIDVSLASSSSLSFHSTDHKHVAPMPWNGPRIPSNHDTQSPTFLDPFSPTTPISDRRKGRSLEETRRISPTTVLSSGGGASSSVGHGSTSHEGTNGDSSLTWVAPESWAVLGKGDDPLGDDNGDTDDESLVNGISGRSTESGDLKAQSTVTGDQLLYSQALTSPTPLAEKRKHKPVISDQTSIFQDAYLLPIYRADNTRETLIVPFNVTVADLIPALNQKLSLKDGDIQHRLYLKERGGERVLSPTEKPANIVRRRLEQAGYDPDNGLDLLGEGGLTFLLKFVYKSQLLGFSDDDLTFDNNFDFIDLTGRSLRAIPVILHQQADSIISLKLSRNPMLEIPLDFIQSCTTLRELRLSYMAMKKVPQSVRHASTLHRLDISSNRINDLEDAGLDEIPDLLTLFAQNNRIEKLPAAFSSHHSLTTLNISNNKFRSIPTVVTELKNLRDLDVSFNIIPELPENIGDLQALERLIIVGNQVSRFPDSCCNLINLRALDCRRNQISDLSIVCKLPNIHNLSADHNVMHALDLSIGPNLMSLDVSHNDITQLSLVSGLVGKGSYALTTLDLSYAKLFSLDDFAIGQITSLRTLRLDHNAFRYLPDSIGDLTLLESLSCSDNKLDALPCTIGKLQKLDTLDAHNNSLTELSQALWECSSLTMINVTSNFIRIWQDPQARASPEPVIVNGSLAPTGRMRTPSSASVGSGLSVPPLVHSLEKLYLGENRLTDDVLHPLMILRELRVLNLSFNDIQDLPLSFFRNLTNLEELYLSGNKLMSLPTEDIPRLRYLTTLFLNGNKLQTLPQELGKVKSLMILDVGSNLLKYNINNWEFDWNWNFNKNLKYLNLSGNKRLQIKSEPIRTDGNRFSRDIMVFGRQNLSGFTGLGRLRVLGLMDVTVTTTAANTTVDIPDESDDRRVRTSLSTVNGMAYGIADTLGRNDNLDMLDLVHEFHGRKGEALFAIFGHAKPPKMFPLGASPNRLPKFLHDNFVNAFIAQLSAMSHRETISDVLRRTFLKLNQDLHQSLFTSQREITSASTITPPVDPVTLRSGACGIALYFKGRSMHVANVGNTLAVISRQGVAEIVSRKHDPYDRGETARIRAAEGWVSPPGLVNDEVDVSRSFGFFQHLPIVNARPDVFVRDLTDLDEFVIVANRGLWDFVPYQTAVDIARTVSRTERPDPMIAAQKLRDFAISYGADCSTMIMVIWVADLFENSPVRSRQPTMDSIIDPQLYRIKKQDGILDRNIARLDGEVNAPIGHLALVFTDIRNSTHLWEVNPGMPTAMRLHNSLLRRQLRFCGGYEVKTEGDAFMCSFPTALSAVWWCLTVQNQLLHEQWPLEILECEDGKRIRDSEGRLIAGGLSVRMGVHCGSPVCEPDPITSRMDYFGPIVNRAARISGNAAGGQIMCSADIIREINAKILESEPETEYSRVQPPSAVDAIRRMGVVVVPVGEVKLKGLEVPEVLSLIYPSGLEGRQDLKEGPTNPPVSDSRVEYSLADMRQLGIICLRLEFLASGRIYKPSTSTPGNMQLSIIGSEANGDNSNGNDLLEDTSYDPICLLPPMDSKSTDMEMMHILDSLSVRIQNAMSSLVERFLHPKPKTSIADKLTMLAALKEGGGLDARTLQYVMSMFEKI